MRTFSKNNEKNFQRTSARNFLENSQKKKKKKNIKESDQKKKKFLGQGIWKKILKTFLRKRVSEKILKERDLKTPPRSAQSVSNFKTQFLNLVEIDSRMVTITHRGVSSISFISFIFIHDIIIYMY